MSLARPPCTMAEAEADLAPYQNTAGTPAEMVASDHRNVQSSRMVMTPPRLSAGSLV